MSIIGLLNQTIAIYNRSNFDAYGRATFSDVVNIRARFEKKQIVKMSPDGKVNIIEAICYVPAGTLIAINDKILHLNESYKVHSRYDTVDGTGATHHIKLELIKWV